MAENSELTMKLDLDCSEAITGLKAIQREAKEATKAIRELEYVKEKQVSDHTTTELVAMLSDRENVYNADVHPGQQIKLNIEKYGKLILIEKGL